MTERIIESEACIAEGLAHLRRVEPRFRGAIDLAGEIPLRRRKDGFETLLDAIVSQQLSVAAADTIWSRLKKARLTGPRKVLAATEEQLRACGLSRPKVRYARALAEHRLDFRALRTLPTSEVVARLTEVKGVGVWTAEIYAMFALGHADAFAAGDLALQEGARVLFELDDRPGDGALRELAEPWSPWRGVAARVLWAYYRLVKQREGTR